MSNRRVRFACCFSGRSEIEFVLVRLSQEKMDGNYADDLCNAFPQPFKPSKIARNVWGLHEDRGHSLET